MTKVRKVKRRKTFRVNVNRKRLRNKLRKVSQIECEIIKKAWEDERSTRSNLNAMGLAYDPNDILKIPNAKHELVEETKLNLLDSDIDCISKNIESVDVIPPKIHVAEELDAFAKLPRERRFQLPQGQVQFITYLMDKYDEDYKAMARDRKNYDQLTWKQIRSKIKTFMGIPDQYEKYLQSKSN